MYLLICFVTLCCGIITRTAAQYECYEHTCDTVGCLNATIHNNSAANCSTVESGYCAIHVTLNTLNAYEVRATCEETCTTMVEVNLTYAEATFCCNSSFCNSYEIYVPTLQQNAASHPAGRVVTSYLVTAFLLALKFS